MDANCGRFALRLPSTVLVPTSWYDRWSRLLLERLWCFEVSSPVSLVMVVVEMLLLACL